MKEYFFETTCISSDYDSIDNMKDQAIKISYKTMLKHCNSLKEKAKELGYDLRKDSKNSHGITLKNDWHVNFYKSNYQGKPCYYFTWSGIEFIWIKN